MNRLIDLFRCVERHITKSPHDPIKIYQLLSNLEYVADILYGISIDICICHGVLKYEVFNSNKYRIQREGKYIECVIPSINWIEVVDTITSYKDVKIEISPGRRTIKYQTKNCTLCTNTHWSELLQGDGQWLMT